MTKKPKNHRWAPLWLSSSVWGGEPVRRRPFRRSWLFSVQKSSRLQISSSRLCVPSARRLEASLTKTYFKSWFFPSSETQYNKKRKKKEEFCFEESTDEFMNVRFLLFLPDWLLRESLSLCKTLHSRDSSHWLQRLLLSPLKLNTNEISERGNSFFVSESELWREMCFSFPYWTLGTVIFAARVEPQCFILHLHVIFGSHTPASIVIWRRSAGVIHQRRSHSCWYFNLWALTQSRAFVYSPRILPVHSARHRGASDLNPHTHTCATHTHSSYLYPSFVFHLPVIGTTIWNKRDSLI